MWDIPYSNIYYTSLLYIGITGLIMGFQNFLLTNTRRIQQHQQHEQHNENSNTFYAFVKHDRARRPLPPTISRHVFHIAKHRFQVTQVTLGAELL